MTSILEKDWKTFLDDFPEDTCGILLFIYHVIAEAFENAKPRPKPVSKPQIEKVTEALEARASRSTTESIERSPEPFALK